MDGDMEVQHSFKLYIVENRELAYHGQIGQINLEIVDNSQERRA